MAGGSMKMYGKHRFPGRLFIVEGIDGSGKSTQLMLLKKWLESEGYVVYFSEWNSSPLVRDVTKRGKKKKMLTPMTFSLIHATDFADRTEHDIIPPLKAGAVVLADRYIYTAFARDVVRGVSPSWVRGLYDFAVKPTVPFYFRVPLDVAMKRILGGRDAIKYYEAGMERSSSNMKKWLMNLAWCPSTRRVPLKSSKRKCGASSCRPWKVQRRRGFADGSI
jgi:dTMP kinase